MQLKKMVSGLAMAALVLCVGCGAVQNTGATEVKDADVETTNAGDASAAGEADGAAVTTAEAGAAVTTADAGAAGSESADAGENSGTVVVYFTGTGNTEVIAKMIAGDLSEVLEYDTVYLGYPIWWGTVPRIVETFAETYDLSGKTVYTFCTSGGSGIERSIRELEEVVPGLEIEDGLRFPASASEETVRNGLQHISDARPTRNDE